MDKNKLCLIFNPAAKGEKARFVQDKLHRLAKGATILATEWTGDAEKLAAAAVEQGFETIVAAGGDGTVNQVVNGIGDSGVALGILPIGTTNVFAYELGLPLHQVRKCWEIILAGARQKIDLALANDQYFVQFGGVGLDALAVQETDPGIRRSIGPLSYIISAAQVISRSAPRLKVHVPGRRMVEACFVLVGNGRHYGGPFCLFQEAKNDDGVLDILLFQNQGYLDILRYLQGILLGNHTELDDIDYFQASSLSISTDQPVPVEIDGEVALQTPVQFKIAPGPLTVLVPSRAF